MWLNFPLSLLLPPSLFHSPSLPLSSFLSQADGSHTCHSLPKLLRILLFKTKLLCLHWPLTSELYLSVTYYQAIKNKDMPIWSESSGRTLPYHTVPHGGQHRGVWTKKGRLRNRWASRGMVHAVCSSWLPQTKRWFSLHWQPWILISFESHSDINGVNKLKPLNWGQNKRGMELIDSCFSLRLIKQCPRDCQRRNRDVFLNLIVSKSI